MKHICTNFLSLKTNKNIYEIMSHILGEYLQSTLMDLVFLTAPRTDIFRFKFLVLGRIPDVINKDDLWDKDLTKCSSK